MFSTFCPLTACCTYVRRAWALFDPSLSSQEVGEIEKVMDRDFYMTAQEAIEFGVVDKILKKRPREGEGSGTVQ